MWVQKWLPEIPVRDVEVDRFADRMKLLALFKLEAFDICLGSYFRVLVSVEFRFTDGRFHL